MMRLHCALALVAMLAAGTAHADAGQLLARQRVGDATLTLMAEPTPLRAGAAIFSAMLQDEDGAPVTDARLRLRVSGPGSSSPREFDLQTSAGNRLFRQASVELPSAGDYRVEVIASLRGQGAKLSTSVQVGEAPGGLRRYWSAIALGPAGALLVALQQWRAARRRRRPTRTAGSPS